MTEHVTDEQRRAVLWHRHLTLRDTSEEVVDALGCMHATNLIGVHLGVYARSARPASSDADINRVLWQQRTHTRQLAMRRTMFVAANNHWEMFRRAASDRVADTQQRQLEKLIVDTGVVPSSAAARRWFTTAVNVAVGAVEQNPGATTAQIADTHPRLTQRLTLGANTRHPSTVSVASRALLYAATRGKLRHGQPSGAWASTVGTWEPGERRRRASGARQRHMALVEAVEMWLARYGPGSETDLVWYFGLPKTQVRAALRDADVRTVHLDGGATGYVHAHDPLDAPSIEAGRCVFLGELDTTPMGWSERDWYNGQRGTHHYDTMGNIGPTVWWAGRIVGLWAQRRDGSIVWELDSPYRGVVDDELVEHEAQRLERWLDGRGIRLAFPTPGASKLQNS